MHCIIGKHQQYIDRLSPINGVYYLHAMDICITTLARSKFDVFFIPRSGDPGYMVTFSIGFWARKCRSCNWQSRECHSTLNFATRLEIVGLVPFIKTVLNYLYSPTLFENGCSKNKDNMLFGL